jgi:hypothetical protein
MEEEILPNFKPFGEEKTDEDLKNYIDNYINTCKEVVGKLKPFMPKEDKVDIEKSLPEHIGEVIKEKNKQIYDLEKKKNEMVEKIIGQMYKGVLIPESVTIRNSECYRYRKRNWTLSAVEILKQIKKNLHEVASKLTDKNLEIIEYLFEKYNLENEQQNDYRHRRKDKDKINSFDKLRLLDFGHSWNRGDTIEMIEVNSVEISNEGNIKFGIRDKGEERFDEESLSNRLHKMLCFKFNTQLKEMSKEFISELDTEINTLKTDLEEIKQKGSNLLMIAEIQKGTDNVRGWGN